MIASGADLHVGEVRWQIRVRVTIRLLYHDRCSPPGGRSVAELAITI